MLHILWLILKTILILVGILLGLLIIALLLILFCPVRYSAEASGDLKEWKRAEAGVSVSWLFRGIKVNLWLKDGAIAHSIRILGIPLEKLLHRKKSSAAKKKSSDTKKRDSDTKKKDSDQTKKNTERTADSGNKEKTSAALKEISEDSSSISQIENAAGRQEETPEKNTGGRPEAEQPDAVHPVKEKSPNAFTRIKNKISAFWDKLKKIPETIRNFTSKIQGLYDKIDYWKQFLTHPKVKEAFAFAWQSVKTLLRHIFPTRIEGQIVFGSEDPSLTGTVLAVLGITIPFHKNCIEVHPVFDGTNLLTGNVKLRGRVYGFVLAKTALQIYFNKNIKYVINRWKHKEESL